jgi:PPK2 family polyphosphate:nucleotide phosphotransferase
MDTERFRVLPGITVRLSDWPTRGADGEGGPDKDEAKDLLAAENERLADLQQLLFAQSEHKVLVVLQGMDTSGKDGTIKHVFHTINPLGVEVANFKRPNEVEQSHDYLWRVHRRTPASGHLTIFNRSHYEDVLVVRVHDLVPEKVWRRRYDHLRNFEQLLADEGTTIRKFFLHISKDEQRERLQERLDNPAKHWKFEHGDLDERKRWDDYQRAYEEVLSRTSTDEAPWYIVPSDQKWFRNLVISQVLNDALTSLDMTYPEPEKGLDGLSVD